MREQACVHAASPSPSVRFDRVLSFRKGIVDPIEPERSPFWTFLWMHEDRPCKDRRWTVHGRAGEKGVEKAPSPRRRRAERDGDDEASWRWMVLADGTVVIRWKRTKVCLARRHASPWEDNGAKTRRRRIGPWDGVVTGRNTLVRMGNVDNNAILGMFLVFFFSVRSGTILSHISSDYIQPPTRHRC